MSEPRSPLLEQFEQAIIDNERQRREYQRWLDMDRGCTRDLTDCQLHRGVVDERKKLARTQARVKRLRQHLVNALEYQIDSARDYRALVQTGDRE